MGDSFSNYIFQRLDTISLPQVKRFYRENGMRAQAARIDEVYVLKADSQLLAALRLCPMEDAWLLRSMCVKQSNRRQGLGRYLLERLQPVLATKACYSFPYSHLSSFYMNAGFSRIHMEQAPDNIQKQFSIYKEQGKKIVLMKHQIDMKQIKTV